MKEGSNKKLVLEAFRHAVEQARPRRGCEVLLARYIQRSAQTAPGRECLFDLIKSLPPTLKYESGTIVANGAANGQKVSAIAQCVEHAGMEDSRFSLIDHKARHFIEEFPKDLLGLSR